ncbi:MAG: tetratricopeptide repeat protein, partial [Deltaproteobacteria bacterium]|nr:tetratricopeptide repeat protein [Deltaproteobacteria bacterium]
MNPKLCLFSKTKNLEGKPWGGTGVPIEAGLSGVPPGSYRLDVNVGDRRYTLWGTARKPGDGAYFEGAFWIPVGRTQVTLRTKGAETVTFTVERKASKPNKLPDIGKAQAQIAKAQKALSEERNPNKRNSRIYTLANAYRGLATAYRRREQYSEERDVYKKAFNIALQGGSRTTMMKR